MGEIILFDLGDTLIYRDRSLIDCDLNLICDTYNIPTSKVQKALNKWSITYPGVYSPWKDNNKCFTLESEDIYNKDFFIKVFKELNLDEFVDNYYNQRIRQTWYKIFPKTMFYLSMLRKRSYVLGIFTNGRPSRRRTLEQLNISEYFDPNYFFISDEIKLTKPHLKTFKYIENILSPNRIIFCDDETQNIQVAKKLNWSAIKINHKKDGFHPLDNI